MKNKKGFTLIELLAVIVILAIIALIVTPVVSNIVANARIAANARSVEGHIRNIELAIITKAFGENSTGDLDFFDTITSGATIESSLSRPGNDNVTCSSYTIKHGTVLSASGCKDNENKWDKTYTYSNSEGAVVFEFKGTYVAPTSGQTHLGIVYMDPTDVKAVCNSNSSITTTPSGCKKFYIYDDSGGTYKMINDRNLEAKIAWNSSGSNASMSTAFTQSLDKIKEAWESTGNVRLITADEIAAIVEKENWSSSTATTSDYFYFGSKDTTNYSSQTTEQKSIQQSYHWLFDYTNGCTSYGCQTADSSTYGYWTSNKVSGTYNYVWHVAPSGILSHYGYANSTNNGIRPVLEIPKSLIG